MTFLPEFKQVLTRKMGWIDLGDYYKIIKKSSEPILCIQNGHCKYKCPTSFASSYYNGHLLDIKTNTDRVFLKPSTDIGLKKAFLLKEHDELLKFNGFQVVFKIEIVMWKGNMMCLTFENSILLPIKFENDYILIPT